MKLSSDNYEDDGTDAESGKSRGRSGVLTRAGTNAPFAQRFSRAWTAR